MGSRSREVMQRLADRENLVRTQTEDRPVTADVCLRGVGLRRIQVVCEPSFSDGYSWDVRQRADDWLLYRALVPTDADTRCVRGFDRLDGDPQKLHAFFNDLCEITLPVKPDLSGMGGCDGTGFELALFGDLFSSIRIQWWSEYPPQWKPLVQIADRMMHNFRGCPTIEPESSPNTA